MVLATDERGNSDQRSINLIHDNLPELTATAPLDQSVALPTVPVEASCRDDLAGCVVELLVNDRLQRSAPSTLSGPLDLSAWERQLVTVTLRARDSAGQVVRRDVSVYVENGARLDVRVELPGPILDVDERRLLYVTASPA
jgi:hypothetical protein